MKVLRTGMQWCELEVDQGSWKTIYNLFNKYVRCGIFKTCYEKILGHYVRQRRQVQGHSARYCATDTTFIKSIFGVDLVGPNPTDRGRNASKLSVIVDDIGVPFAAVPFRANQNDCTLLESTFANIIINIKDADAAIDFFGDKGYDSRRCNDFVKEQGFNSQIKKRGTHNQNGENKRRIVENTFSWLDLYRRLILRYDKHINTYMEFTFFALCVIVYNKCASL